MRRRLALSWSVVAAACFISAAQNALAEPMEGMCDPPKMKTEKWQQRSENGGITILIPPGFGAGGIGSGIEQAGAHYYFNGEHRTLIVGFGSGIQSILRDPTVSEKGECETEIDGRRVLITVYNWLVEDSLRSASGNAGAHFAAVARFYPTASQREVFVAFISNVTYEVKSFRQIFWTVSFGDPPAATTAASPATASTVAATSPAAAAPAAGPSCAAAPPPPGLPAASAVIDSSVVQTLLAGVAPIPNGFEVMSLQFDASGELAGMAVAQSDLPEASQRELAAVVGTNLKPHDSHAPASILLRIDAAAAGLHYTVLPASTCSQ
jgi:hypothetical protein